ncbi:Putative mutator protein MutT4 [Tritonibacter multivorans]|uniref:Putative mutator protein MutT4 n=1 Tax=Tritonibacter multivorans TaxID=928856 RepID=A0A0P1G2X9_9RHOB|nr:NUDIX hydrolase [Tritonibacter multivorans]MDA7419729.1 NUDIX hydrolase [Tritonibacter multivorans]CUH76060.1 Putative mutator protein MutT4 [Tritonibacter multivorans]SFC56066.1 ADP-ribose pyrophosphatase YjhB, NUDIX family [Tritonibacter multivorans]
MTARPVLGAIAVLCEDINDAPHVLLVQRGKAPNAGFWGFPGGHVELGETASDAALRELHEETGLTAKAAGHLRNIDVIQRNSNGAVERHYLLVATLCTHPSGTLQAADDAADAAWIPVDALDTSDLKLLDQVAEVAREALARVRRTAPAAPAK